MVTKFKRLVVLGSTGSIGRQTLDIVRAMPGHFKIIGLAGGSNLALLEEQAREFQPRYFFTANKDKSAGQKISALGAGYLPIEEMAVLPEADIVVVAVSGAAGIGPVLAAARAGKIIALANKESLVAAGEIITAAVKASKARLLPVDSEHSAIFQCLNGEKQPPRRLILTASGGPFLDFPAVKMPTIAVAQALAHPSWKMGRKVTIDSATLMNKGLEIIEAHWLFGVPIDEIKILVHPSSIVHSMVEFADGSVKAQLSRPDMRLPILYALSFPGRLPSPGLPRLDWDAFPDLSFRPPDMVKFRCLGLAMEAGKQGGTCPAVLCAADEVAVELFLKGKIRFTDIASIVEKTLAKHKNTTHPALEEILAADKWARREALKLAGGGG